MKAERLFDRVDFILAGLPPAVTNAILAAWRDPSSRTLSMAELAVALHAGDLDARSPEVLLLWVMLERAAGRDLGQHLLARLADLDR